jgi:hypothetical protein
MILLLRYLSIPAGSLGAPLGTPINIAIGQNRVSPKELKMSPDALPSYVTDAVDVVGKKRKPIPRRRPMGEDMASMPPYDRAHAPGPGSEADITSSGGLPTWAKALIAVGGLGALAAAIKNRGNFVQPGGAPLNWGAGLGAGMQSVGQSMMLKAESKDETERMRMDLANKAYIEEMKRQPDPLQFMNRIPPEPWSIYMSKLGPGEVPYIGDPRLQESIKTWKSESEAASKETGSRANIRLLDTIAFLKILAPELLENPAVARSFRKAFGEDISMSDTGEQPEYTLDELLNMMQAKGGIFGN